MNQEYCELFGTKVSETRLHTEKMMVPLPGVYSVTNEPASQVGFEHVAFLCQV